MSGHNQNSMQIAEVQFYALGAEPQVLEVLDDAELDAVSGGKIVYLYTKCSNGDHDPPSDSTSGDYMLTSVAHLG